MNCLKNPTLSSCWLAFVLSMAPALAQTTFTIEDPPVDFEVIDAEPFDGIGDNGPFSTFNDAVLGSEGEARSTAEFDISTFSIPPGEIITAATLEVRISSVGVFGLGVNGECPEGLAVDGFIGNGIAELSDFQAGDGNLLDWVATSDPYVGQVVSFNVTSFVTEVVNAHEHFLALTVRASSFGGLMVEERNGYPKLTIETTSSSGATGPAASPYALFLHQSAPNPFTSATRIDYCIPGEGGGPAAVTIHDATGRSIRTLLCADQAPGIHHVVWDGTDCTGSIVSDGVYFCRLRWNGVEDTQRMLLTR